MAFLVGGANSAAAADTGLTNSLRFNDPDNPILSLDIGSDGDRRQCTISMWVKKSHPTERQMMFYQGDDNGNSEYVGLEFNASAQLNFFAVQGGVGSAVTVMLLRSSALFRDPAAWYHIVANIDTDQGSAADRANIYVNGTQITDFSTTAIYPDQNTDLNIGNNADDYIIGGAAFNKSFDGYISEVYYIDGTQYAASAFGETNDDGIWIPKEAKDDLTFGTNGFFLEFKETGTSQNSSGIGADTSGEDNHLAVTNLAATNQTTDTPTNNFATFNPLMTYADIVSNDDDLTFSEGNTKVTGGTGGTSFTPSVSSIGVSNGKWYYEFYNPTTDSGTEIAGAMNYDYSGGKGINDAFIGIRASNGDLYNNGSTSSVGTEWKDSGDILSVKLNMDDDEISFSTNGATYTSAVSITGNAGADGILHPVVFLADDEVATVNFGNPNWALSSGNADANGYGNFEYAVPSGYYALCTKNLAIYG